MATDRATDTQDQTRNREPVLEDFLDLEFEAFCAREGDEDVKLEEVLRATSSIPGSLAEAIIVEERAERF